MEFVPPHPTSEQSFCDPNNPHERIPFPSLDTPPTLDLSVIVPAYNEGDRLPPMLDEAISYLESRRKSATTGLSYEFIIVDDGSTDLTAAVAQTYAKTHSTDRVRVLRMQRNVGKGGAVRKGALSSRGRMVLMADADGATVFSDMEKLEAALTNEQFPAQVAVGSRAHLRREAVRGVVSRAFKRVVAIVGGVQGVQDTQCGFKMYVREAVRVAFEGQMLRRWAFDVENLYRVQCAGMNIVEVPVRWSEIAGSKLSVVKASFNMMFDMMRMRWMYGTGLWKIVQPYSGPLVRN